MCLRTTIQTAKSIYLKKNQHSLSVISYFNLLLFIYFPWKQVFEFLSCLYINYYEGLPFIAHIAILSFWVTVICIRKTKNIDLQKIGFNIIRFWKNVYPLNIIRLFGNYHTWFSNRKIYSSPWWKLDTRNMKRALCFRCLQFVSI